MSGIQNRIRRGLDILALALAVLGALCMAAIVCLITVSVAMRKLAHSPLHVTEELVGLLLSVSLFLCLPMVTLKSAHVRVSLVLDYSSEKIARLLVTLGLVFGAIFFAWTGYDSIAWLEFAHRLSLKTEASRLLLYPWMAVVPLSLVLTGLIFGLRLVGLLDSDKPEIPEA